MGALDGKVAIVTGSGRGIGRATAVTLAQHGATVVVADPGVEMDGTKPAHTHADETVQEIESHGGKALASYTDVSDFNAAGSLMADAVGRFGHVDIVVNNAGLARRRMIWDMSEQDWDAVLDVHLKGTFNCTRWALPHMIKQRWGRIINTLSPAGIMNGTARRGNYGAAKGGIYAFTNVAAVELADTGVTANCVCPSTSDTRLLRTSLEEAAQESEATAAVIRTIKPTPPAHVAQITAYLCTEEASDISGRFFYSNGGEIQTIQPLQLKPLLNKDGMWALDELTKAMAGAKGNL